MLRLQRSSFDATIKRVDTADAFGAALDREPWDAIVADHSLPRYDAPRALALLKQKALDLPFIVLSGTISQPAAVELMRMGAHDFVFKDDQTRLEQIIVRELREADSRRARRKVEAERVELLAQLESANRAKDEFLALLGHELRNPLAPIVTALDLMRRQGGEPSARALGIMERQVGHLVRLVDDLLDVTRIVRGKVELKKNLVELAAIIDKGIEMASPLIEQKRHRFNADVPRTGLLVEVDEARLAQIVSNLLTNAARYTADGGELSITGGEENGQAVIRVKDTGMGITAETLPTIFEMFVQGKRRIDRGEGGLGLGLALVKNLTALHGGTVEALSEGANRGSEFIVRLPLPPSHTHLAAAKAVTPKELPAIPETRRLLLVDDNVDAVDMLAEVLELQGFAVDVAYDGSTALTAMEKSQPSIVVLDIGLPVMDGYEVAKKIRERPQFQRTRLVALTGYGQPSDKERASAAGFDRHLVKPVDIALLLRTVDELLPAA
jgi:signal transduction histidine kinase